MYIQKTMESVLHQKGDFTLEYIIVDGNSTDETPTILEDFNKQITIIREADTGQANALNKGFHMASGDILGWLNADDLYCKNALAIVHETFKKNKNIKWMYGKCFIIDDNNIEIRKFITWYKNRRQSKFKYKKLLLENFISQPAVFFRKDFLLQTGFLNESLIYTMDYELWLRMAANEKPAIVPEWLAQFRRHSSSKSETAFKAQFDEQFRVMCNFSNQKIIHVFHKILTFRTIVIYNLLKTLNLR